jgi:hypothetical protein
MASFDRILQNECRLRAFTGLTIAQFMAFLPFFATAMEQYLARYTLDGYLREGDRAVTYANSPLPSAADRLLFILTYLKQNTTQEVHGQIFAMTQSNVSKWIHFLLDMLERALAQQNMLPARTAAALAAQLRADPVPADPEAPPLFFMMAPNGP